MGNHDQPWKHGLHYSWEYHMHVQYQKSIFLKKKKLSQVTIKKSVFFSMSDMFKNTHQPHWEIQMDWESDV